MSLIVLFCVSSLHPAAAQVGIGTNSPNVKAMLDIQSDSKGLLIPRMSTAQRNGIESPPEGLIVFNNDTKRIEVYTSANTTPAAYTPEMTSLGARIGSSYREMFPGEPGTWMVESRGMGQSFTATGSGMLTAISISVGGVEAASTSSTYELNIFAGLPATSCGITEAGSCTISSFGEPIATSFVTVKAAGVVKLRLFSPVFLVEGQKYTFTITPTVGSQGFTWDGDQDEYAGGESFGIDGNVSNTGHDFYFQTHYSSSGWRSL